jgi:hypothetical protein
MPCLLWLPLLLVCHACYVYLCYQNTMLAMVTQKPHKCFSLRTFAVFCRLVFGRYLARISTEVPVIRMLPRWYSNLGQNRLLPSLLQLHIRHSMLSRPAPLVLITAVRERPSKNDHCFLRTALFWAPSPWILGL